MADEQAAGTPGATPEGAVTDSGTPVASQDGSGAATVDAKELESLRNIREQFLREKENTERIRQENEWLREQQAQRANPPATGYGYAAPPTPLQQQFAAVQERDPEVAGLLMETIRAQQQEFATRDAKLRYREELAGIPAADRAETERLAKAEGIWPDLAHAKLQRDRFQKKEHELAEQSRKLQEERDRISRGVVRTDAAPAPPAPTNNGNITSAQWAQIARDAASGNAEARKKVRDYDEGRLKVRDD